MLILWCGVCVRPILPAVLYWLWFPLNYFSCRWQRDRDGIDTTFLLVTWEEEFVLGSKRLWISPVYLLLKRTFYKAMTSLGSENLCRQASCWKLAISHFLAHWNAWSLWISCPNWFACILWWVFLKMCLCLVFWCLLHSCSPPTGGWQNWQWTDTFLGGGFIGCIQTAVELWVFLSEWV